MRKTPKKLEVEVTSADLRNGARTSTRLCPIALAARRALCKVSIKPEVVLVWRSRMLVCGRGKDTAIYSLPEEARHFVEAFDDAQSVRPFSATLSRWDSASARSLPLRLRKEMKRRGLHR